MSLGLKYKNNEQILQSGSAAVCRICPIRFLKIQESSITDFLPDWVESVPGASVL